MLKKCGYGGGDSITVRRTWVIAISITFLKSMWIIKILRNLCPCDVEKFAACVQRGCVLPMRGSRKFCQRGSNSGKVFLLFFLMMGELIGVGAIIGPPAKRYLNGVSLAGR